MGKGLENAISKLEKKFGKGTVNKMKDMVLPDIETFSSGSLGLDIALGGGYPKGRIIEIFGPESSGKTTFCLHALAEIQKKGGVGAFIDAEHALDPEYARAIGVDMEELVFCQPDNGEQALEVLDELILSGEVGIVIVDSVAALVPQAELTRDMGDSSVGLQARMMSQAMRKITGSMSRTGTTVIFINQLRDKIGVMFGSPEVTTGGNALKFYASQRLDVRRIKTEKEGEESVGNRTRITVKKNKIAPPFRKAEVTITFGVGIDREQEILDYGVELEIIDKSGSWLSYGDTRLGQGNKKVVELLRDNPELYEELLSKIQIELKSQEK